MEKGNSTINCIDTSTKLIAGSKDPVEQALSVENLEGVEFLNGILIHAVRVGDMYTANAVHKAMFLNSLYRTNKFVSANNNGQGQEYLNSLSKEERNKLMDDFFIKMNLNFVTPDDYEAIAVLSEYLKQSSLSLK